MPEQRVGRRWRVRRSDLLAIVALLAIPVLIIGIPAIFGHPLLPGDDFRQGLPLRVLVGRDIAGGQLPLWNPYIWSGTPLLGGFNAGALYPPVLLFSLLPPITAWTFSLILTYWICITGTYLLARKLELSPIPSFLTSATFSFLGAMSTQVVHVEIIDGYAWIPWFLLSVEGLACALRKNRTSRVECPGSADGHTPANPRISGTGVARNPDGYRGVGGENGVWPLVRWVALGGFSVGMAALSGSPDALERIAIVGGLVAIWHAARHSDFSTWRERRLFVLLVAAMAVWGATVGAVQLLPGLSFHAISQTTDGAFMYAFSFVHLPFWTWLLLLIPGLTGGNGNFGLPYSTSIVEFMGYAGLLPLMAIPALLSRSFGKRKDPLAGKWAMWILITVAGALLAMAPSLPGGSLLAHLPLYGDMRIQARNLLLVDLGLAVLLGYFADRVLLLAQYRQSHIIHSNHTENGTSDGHAHQEISRLEERTIRPEMDRWEIAAATAPIILVVALAVLSFACPELLERATGLSLGIGNLALYMLPFIAYSAILAVETAFFAIALPRLPLRAIRGLLLAICLTDVVFFSLAISPIGLDITSSVTAAVPPMTTNEYTLLGQVPTPTGTGKRVALFRHGLYYLSVPAEIANLNPDRNIYGGIASVQGYGTLVWKTYDSQTCTHSPDSLRVSALRSTTFDELDLGILVAAPGSFTTGAGPVLSSIASVTARTPKNTARAGRSRSTGYTHLKTTSRGNISTRHTINWGVCPPSAYSSTSSSAAETPPAPIASTVINSHAVTLGLPNPGSSEWFIGSPKTIAQVIVTLPQGTPLSGINTTAARSPANGPLVVQLLVPEHRDSGVLKVVRSSTATAEPPTANSSGSSGSANSSQGFPDTVSAVNSGTTARKNGHIHPNSNGHGEGSTSRATAPEMAIADFTRPAKAVALRITGTGSTLIRPTQVTLVLTSGKRLDVTGTLANAILPGHWAYQHTVGSFTVYSNLYASGHLRIIPFHVSPNTRTSDRPNGGGTGGRSNQRKPNLCTDYPSPTPSTSSPLGFMAGSHANIIRAYGNGTEIDRVTTPAAAMLIRSEAWAPGWTATIQQAGGHKTLHEAVQCHGLVQAVLLPAGTSTITFTYWPPKMTEGLVLSGIGWAGLMIVIVTPVVVATRRQYRLHNRRSGTPATSQ